MIKDDRTRSYQIPNRVVWQTDSEAAHVENAAALLQERSGQISLKTGVACVLRNAGGQAGLLLDFGSELQGGIQILTWSSGQTHNARVRIRFGESVGEAMSEIGEKGSSNDHAIRDFTTEVSFLGMAELGNTGFRFVRIDLLDDPGCLEIKAVRAVRLQTERQRVGSFNCSDPLLNRIWQVGADTVELNLQHYLWDGIKRDRLVWIGDMYPETAAVQAVFGQDAAVPRSLDFIRDETPLPEWMNGIPSYSMWWILIHRSWYRQSGDLSYLRAQRDYLLPLLHRIAALVASDGTVAVQTKFVDWSSADNPAVQNAILQSILLLALRAGAELCAALAASEAKTSMAQPEAGNAVAEATATLAAGQTARQAADRLLTAAAGKIDCAGSKQAAALLALAGLTDCAAANQEVLAQDGARGLSAFLGYFVLQARAAAGDAAGCLPLIRAYWGGMLRMGATTFWEEFDVDWMAGAARIDEFPAAGQKDIHGDTGRHCFTGYRKSLCHGWAAGPTPWLSEHVLGFQPLEPGCRLVRIAPELGDLSWAEGTYPTPLGPIHVRHRRLANGRIVSAIDAPAGVKIQRPQRGSRSSQVQKGEQP